MPRQASDLDVLYEDDALLVINKPAGLLVLPDRWDPHKSTAIKLVQAYIQAQRRAMGQAWEDEPRVWVVHRLDKETSGVLVLAKSAGPHAALSQQFEHGQVRKSYLALVRGHVLRTEGIIKLPIGAHPSRAGLMAVRHRHGKSAVTRYAVLERFRGFTLLDVQPETGRTHQIRVHLSAIRHPLAIDPLYGSCEGMFLSALKPAFQRKGDAEERPLIDRLTLHAQALQLIHPVHGGIVRWMAPLPKDFAAVLRNLRRFQYLPVEPPAPPSAASGREEGA